MAEKPEQVLIENRIAAFRLVEEVRVHGAVHEQHGAGEHDSGHCENDHKGHYHHPPDKNGNAIQRHSRSTHLEGRDYDFHCYSQCRELSEGDHLRPKISALAGSEVRTGERGLGGGFPDAPAECASAPPELRRQERNRTPSPCSACRWSDDSRGKTSPRSRLGRAKYDPVFPAGWFQQPRPCRTAPEASLQRLQIREQGIQIVRL